jgi:ubiquinone/menaquinone biosynthesis C-methylase UbiE
MSTTFTGSVPDNYDRHLRSLLFEPYAEDLAARLAVKPGMRVLEIACGTGIVTRQLLARLPGDATLVATDISPAMLVIAEQRISPDSRLAWQPADALALPFDDASFDAVVCQFGIMFFSDKVKGLAEMRRVLRAGGQLLVNAWDSLDRNPVERTTHQALADAFPSSPPQFLTLPYGYHEAGEIERAVRAAGFATVSVRRVALAGHSPGARDAATGFVRGTPLTGELAERQLSPDAALEAIQRALRAAFGSEAITAPHSALVADGRA